MKKFVATVSLSLSVVFCLALANAQDASTVSPSTTTDTGSMTSGTDTPVDQAGTVSTEQAPTTDTTTDSMTGGGSALPESGDASATAGSLCTDSSGIIYRRGQAGFDRCQSQMSGTGTSPGTQDDMGGQTDTDTTFEGEAGTEGTGTNSDTPVDTDFSQPEQE